MFGLSPRPFRCRAPEKGGNMLTITLRLSESLLCILRDAGSPKPETSEILVEKGTTIRQILLHQGINPLLVPMAGLTTTRGSQRIEMDTELYADVVLTLYGPLAGG